MAEIIDYQPRYRLLLTVASGTTPRLDSPIAASVGGARALGRVGAEGEVDPDSLRLIELGPDGRFVGQVPLQARPREGGRIDLAWILSGRTPPNSMRRYGLYFDARGGERKRPATYEGGVAFVRKDLDPAQDRAMDVEIDGELFTTYNYGWRHTSLYKPYFHPIIGPSGKSVTQNGEFPGTLKGHYWHRGLFVAHGHVDNATFWEEREGTATVTDTDGTRHEVLSGRILHQEFVELDEGPVYGAFTARNLWRTAERDLLEEHRRAVVHRLPASHRIIDIAITLRPVGEAVVLRARPYQLLACRLAAEMNVARVVTPYNLRMYRQAELQGMGTGGIVLDSEGRVNVPSSHAEASDVRARWMDHSGPLDRDWDGLAIFDHPSNQRHPTYWLNWNNMTMGPSFSFNEPYTIERGAQLALRYRVYVHDGDAAVGGVAAAYADYADPAAVEVGHAEPATASYRFT